ncbi:protein lifeguard 1 [Diretmus argenteus]
MSDTEILIASEETVDVLDSDGPLPPPYAYEGRQPPPYSAAPPMYPAAPLMYPAAPSMYPTPIFVTVRTTQPACSGGDLPPGTAADVPFVSSSFDDKTVRRAFVRKVFSIVTLQLVFTFSVVCLFTFSTTVKKLVRANVWVYLSSYIIFMVVAICLSICQSFSRRHPWNIVGLCLVTVSLSYMVGTIASFHNTISVVITMGSTLAITLAIIAFSAQTRLDFTVLYGVLLVLAVDLMVFGFFCTFYYSHVMEIVYGCLGALLFSLFLILDCQLMMGTMRYRLNPEEYINAALVIYLDVILIFLYLLGRR